MLRPGLSTRDNTNGLVAELDETDMTHIFLHCHAIDRQHAHAEAFFLLFADMVHPAKFSVTQVTYVIHGEIFQQQGTNQAGA